MTIQDSMIDTNNIQKEPEEPTNCIECGSDNIVFAVQIGQMSQYRCKSCKKLFSNTPVEIKAVAIRRLIDSEVEKKSATVEVDRYELSQLGIDRLKSLVSIVDNDEITERAKTANWDSLYPFQKDDVEKAVRHVKMDDCPVIFNFNQMGLGKTVEAILTVRGLDCRRILVICTKNLVLNWRKEIAIWDQSDSAITLPQTYNRWDDWLAKFKGKWFITNVDSFRNKKYIDMINKFNFDCVIFDESHHMRNLESAGKARGVFNWLKTLSVLETEATNLLHHVEADNNGGIHYNPRTFKGVPKFDHETKTFDRENLVEPVIIMMTGSPVVNSPMDIYPQLHLVEPDTFVSAAGFQRQYTWANSTWGGGLKSVAFKNARFIESIIAKHGVQRQKKDVLKDLPPKTYHYIPLEMESDQRELYDNVEKGFAVMLAKGEPLHAPNVLAQFIRLRQICVDPILVGDDASSIKTQFLAEFMEEMGEEPFVIFSTFESNYVSLLERMTDKHKIKMGKITGKVDSVTRDANVRAFQNGELQVLACTIQAGGEGLTLTRASHVVLVDRWWTPLANEQAIDRLHRITQINPVNVHILQCMNSFDQYLDSIIRDKMAAAESIKPLIESGDANKDEVIYYNNIMNTNVQQLLAERIARKHNPNFVYTPKYQLTGENGDDRSYEEPTILDMEAESEVLEIESEQI